MSLSVFKRRFAEHFNDSVYHWMMRQKALKVFTDIRDGEDSTKALMNKYGFRHYTQFSRFCKNYLCLLYTSHAFRGERHPFSGL